MNSLESPHSLCSALHQRLFSALSNSLDELSSKIISPARPNTATPAFTAGLVALVSQPHSPKWGALRVLLEGQFGSVENIRSTGLGELDSAALQQVRIALRRTWDALGGEATDEDVTVVLRWLAMLNRAVKEEIDAVARVPEADVKMEDVVQVATPA
ncbi:hypothetical protein RQP46_008896 [Phenoliferia psychrophenolica]